MNMTSAAQSVATLIRDSAPDSKRLTDIEATDTLSDLKEALGKKVRFSKWSVVFREIIERLNDVLDIGIPDILFRAWNKSDEIDSVLKQSREHPGVTSLVPLAEHRISSLHRPHIQVLYNGETLADIEVEIDLVLDIDAAIVKITDGQIRAISAGSCSVSGSVMIENIKVFELATGRIELS
jgi:hypothetical protein